MSEVFPSLFSPTKLAGFTLNNRIAMAPLRRQMAELDGTSTDEMAAYYARADEPKQSMREEDHDTCRR